MIDIERLPWRMEDYVARMGTCNVGRNDAQEQRLEMEFPVGPEFRTPQGQGKHFRDPLTVVDAGGKILLWYLPGVISQDAQVCKTCCGGDS